MWLAGIFMEDVMDYGYIRVSSKGQNVDRQMSALLKEGVNKKHIYIDKKSGKDFDRPAYKRLIKKLKPEDVLIVKSIDRLGRNYAEILEQWHTVTKVLQAEIYVLDFPLLDTRKKDNDLTGTFIADLVLQILSYVAQTERDFIHQRQAEGIAAAQERGVKFGRKKLDLPDSFDMAKEKYEAGLIPYRKAAELCGMSASSFDRYCKIGK